MKRVSIIGQKFNMLTAVKEVEPHIESPTGRKRRKFLFKCDCGLSREIQMTPVKSGLQISCGCVRKVKFRKLITKHGLRFSKKAEYDTWCGIKKRCLNNKDISYENYGGRGISICERWINSFEDFYKDMGDRPGPEYSIDRINNDGNYEPGNCKWSTRIEQNNNRRKRRWKVKPKELTISHK